MCYSKREEYQVKIRREKRKISQSEFRHKLLIHAFGHDPLVSNSYNITKLIQLLVDYLQDNLDSI